MKPSMWKKTMWMASILTLVGALGGGLWTPPAFAAAPDAGSSCSKPMGQGMMGQMSQMGGQSTMGDMGQSKDQGMMDMMGMMGKMMTMMSNMSQSKDNKGMADNMGQSKDQGGMSDMGQSKDQGMMGGMSKMGQSGDHGMMGNQGMDGQDDCPKMDGMSDHAAPWGRSYAIDPHRVMEMFLADLDPKLSVGVILDLGNRYYVEAVEKDSGAGAYEATISRRDGTVWPEKGPNQMWNQKYGTLGASVTTGTETVTPPAMSVSKDQAVNFARRYLTEKKSGFTLDEAGRAFYGYYNFTVLKDGKPASVISVNGYNGRVWYHSWLEAAGHQASAGCDMMGGDKCPKMPPADKDKMPESASGTTATPTPMTNMPRPMPMETPMATPTA